MPNTISNPNVSDKFGPLRWVAVFIYFAGLLFIFATGNSPKILTLFNLVAGVLACLDCYVVAPRPVMSLLNPGSDVRTKFRPGPLMWAGFAVGLVSLIWISHVRISALLMMSVFCLLVLDRFMRTRPRPIS
jgi:drug/metabolite transporter (DMT)-like permease